jgi:hypothetical protein
MEGIEEEEGDGDEMTQRKPKALDKGFHSFAPKLKGTLFKITPLTSEVATKVDKYVHGGSMERDLIYIRSLYGLVNPSQKREFSFFWESPWVEEHIKDSTKKRKLEEQQKSLAVRTYIRASSNSASIQQEPEDLDKFLNNVSKLTDWEDHGSSASKETVKTVSRIVQSFEKKAVRNILNLMESGSVSKVIALNHLNRLRGGNYGDVDDICHALRRSSITYDAFATLVAAEILFSDGTSGSRNTSIHISKRLDFERQMSALTLIEILQRITIQTALPKDNLGLPLMRTNGKLCVSKGVLVVCGESDHAAYILNIDEQQKLDEILAAPLDKRSRRPQFIEITAQVFTEEDNVEYKNSSKVDSFSTNSKRAKIEGFTSLI